MTNTPASRSINRSLLLLMTTAIAATAANLYYCQPILPLIAAEFTLSPSQLGSISAASQLGYAAALLLISPLGDSVPRKQLIAILSVLLVLAASAAFLAPNFTLLIIAIFLIGLSANITQQLIPFAASLVSPSEKGDTLGTLMMGLTLGILLSRTLSGSIGEHFGWRSVFAMSAFTAALIGVLLYSALPRNTPHSDLRYWPLLKSTLVLFKQHHALRICTLSGACWFASFNALWATLALHVSDTFNYNAQQAGLFGVIALAGVCGAKIAGKWVNRLGSTRLITLALIIIAAGFFISGIYAASLAALVLGIVLIDFGVFSAQVSNQVRVFSIDPAAQSRINGIYMLGYYVGGACGSIVGVKAFEALAWPGVAGASISLVLSALIVNQFTAKD